MIRSVAQDMTAIRSYNSSKLLVFSPRLNLLFVQARFKLCSNLAVPYILIFSHVKTPFLEGVTAASRDTSVDPGKNATGASVIYFDSLILQLEWSIGRI